MFCQNAVPEAGKFFPAGSVATQTSLSPAVWDTESTANHVLFQYFSTVELECFTVLLGRTFFLGVLCLRSLCWLLCSVVIPVEIVLLLLTYTADNQSQFV